MPIIVNTTNNLRGLPDAKKTILQPGANQVSAEVVALVRSCDHTAALVRKGKLIIREDTKAVREDISVEDIPSDVSEYKVPAVRKAAAACEDQRKLMGWLDTDARPAVRKLVMERLEALKAADDARERGQVPPTSSGASEE